MIRPAPIVLFVYNRPTHTQRTIYSIFKNELAADTILYVYSDGPKNSLDQMKVAEVRNVLSDIRGFKQVNIYSRENNVGLAQSIIEGVTSIVSKHGKVIVVEDDLEVSPNFLEYMNNSLNAYSSDSRVMHVSGYMFPVKKPEQLPDTFFYRASSCWGWGTWNRAWQFFEQDGQKLVDEIGKRGAIEEFDIDSAYPFFDMLKLQTEGKVDSWAIRWYASVFLNGGLCLHPAESLVKNIGHDGTGVHCNSTNVYEVNINNSYLPEMCGDAQEDALAVRKIKDYYRYIQGGRIKRIARSVRNKIAKFKMRQGGAQ